MPETTDHPIKKSLLRPSFLVVALVLLISATSLTAVVERLDLHFKKQPVPLEKPLLVGVPKEFGPWVMASIDETMSAEIEEAMGTDQYLTRYYLNRDVLGDLVPDDILKLSGDRLNQIIGVALQKHPEAVVKLHMAYYTGSVDTVPHVPDRCMVAGGFDPVDPRAVTWDVLPTEEPGEYDETKLRFVEFRGKDVAGDGPAFNVAYFFQVNGDYEHDAIGGVRARLMSLQERHAYFCKIELLCIHSDASAAEQGMQDFLRHAMPALEEALPDWDALTTPAAEVATRD